MSLCDGHCILGICLSQQKDEFFPAQSNAYILFTNNLRHLYCKEFKYFIPYWMSVCIVYDFEMVDINHDYRKLFLFNDPRRNDFLIISSVLQTSQYICTGTFFIII